MKNYLILPLGLALMISACKQNSQTNADKVNDEYITARTEAEKSPIKETKLFGGFELGMSPQQIDSVFNVWVHEGKVIKADEADKTEASIIDEEFDNPSIDTYAFMYNSYGLKYPLEIKFSPEYLDDKLVGLFCSVKTPKENINPKEAYKHLADEFENSSRGEHFKKFNMEIEGNPVIVFIKDNLEIMFFTQPKFEESSIKYTHVPLQQRYINQLEQTKKNSSML